MRAATTTVLLIAIAGAGCTKKSNEGLPPASEWKATGADMAPSGSPPTVAGAQAGQGAAMGGPGDPSDPHAGMDMGGGQAGGADPHAGLDMASGGSPHGGSTPDVTQMGLQGPDPSRPIDPNHRLAGTIKVAISARDHVKTNGAIFLIAKAAGADGKPVGPPLAVDKVLWAGDQLPFQLSEANAMIANTQLAGDVIITARYDQDSDALTKEAGDVTGLARVKVPADHVDIVLDTVLTGAQ